MGCSNSKPNVAGSSEKMEFLGKVKLIKRLAPADQRELANAMTEKAFESGQDIITQGADDGDTFYIIKSGTAKVHIDDKPVADLKAGDYFGETALLRDQPRTATIRCTSKVMCYEVTRKQFADLGLLTKLDWPKRGAVGGGLQKVDAKPPTSKTSAQKDLIKKALKANKNLTDVVQLDDQKMSAMIDLMWEEEVQTGTKIISQGDLNADFFYVVMEGSFEITKADGPQSQIEALSPVGEVQTGGSFGELALMYFAPRAATVTAKTNSKVQMISRPQFKNILANSSQEMSKEYVNYLNKVDSLAPLKDSEKLKLAGALQEVVFGMDDFVFKEGEKGEIFYILIDGKVDVIIGDKKVTSLQASTSNAEFFGEKALLSNEPRQATIQVKSQSATALTVDKAVFEMLLGRLEELQTRGKEGTAEVKTVAVGGPSTDRQFGLVLRKDLKRLGLLGCGGFGSVEMVEHLKSGETYALKALSKGYVVKTGMQGSVMSEKNVQLMCDSSFIIKLHETYNGDQSLYLLLELCLGGELYATYNKKNLWGKEDCAKFYVAGTTLAFDHLHSKKIVFRDLKPENLLLNEQGHVKLTDMGLAKVIAGKTYTTCGTPDYFAPELIASKGHNHAVDWWTLGILTFELLSGHPPFESATPMQIYQKVTKGINKVAFPKKCKGDQEDLVKKLCNSNPTERLPVKKGGSDNIKKHEWYAKSGFDWTAMENLQMKAPYLPVVKNKKDIANFTARREDMPPQVHYKDDKTGWDKDFATST